MAGTRELIVDVIARTDKFKSGINDAEKSTQGFTDTAKKVGLAIGGAFAVNAVKDYATESVKAAAEDQKAQEMLAQTMRNTGGATDDQVKKMEDLITSMSKANAIADDDLRPAMANLVRGFGDAGKASEHMQLAIDIAAGTGKDLGTVSEAMMKAAQGNTGALGRLGVATKDASGKAKSADDIFRDLNTTFGGQGAAAADTAAGKFANVQIQMGELKESIGTALLPMLATFSDVLITKIVPALQSMSQFVADNSSWLLPLAGIIGGVVVAMKLWEGAVTAVKTAQMLWNGVQIAFNVIMAANPIILVAAAIAALVAGIIIAYQKVDWFRDAVDAMGRAAVAAFEFLWEGAKKVFAWLRDNWPLLLAILTGPFGLMVKIIIDHWTQIKDAASGAFNFIRGLWDSFIGFLSGLPGRIWNIARGLWDPIVNGFKGAINTILRGWNAIQFKIPGFSVGPVNFGGFTLGLPDVPLLAKGGVFSSPTLGVVGEAGREIVAPEALMRQVIREEGGAVDARVIVNGSVYGVDDLNAWADRRDAKLAMVLAGGRRA